MPCGGKEDSPREWVVRLCLSKGAPVQPPPLRLRTEWGLFSGMSDLGLGEGKEIGIVLGEGRGRIDSESG